MHTEIHTRKCKKEETTPLYIQHIRVCVCCVWCFHLHIIQVDGRAGILLVQHASGNVFVAVDAGLLRSLLICAQFYARAHATRHTSCTHTRATAREHMRNMCCSKQRTAEHRATPLVPHLQTKPCVVTVAHSRPRCLLRKRLCSHFSGEYPGVYGRKDVGVSLCGRIYTPFRRIYEPARLCQTRNRNHRTTKSLLM